MGTETYQCPDCGSAQMRYMFAGEDKLHGLPGSFHSYRCMDCGLISTFPRLDRQGMEQYYPSGYFAGADVLKPPAERRDLRSWWFRHETKQKNLAISKYKRQGRLLDIGCSTGNFLYGMSQTGSWEVYGLEPGRTAAEYVRTWYKFPVVAGTLADADLPAHYFDVVTMWHALEHMPDPRDSLQAIRGLLKPDGLLVMEVPNPDSLDARIFADAWFGFDIPRHYHSFPRRTLSAMALQSGYRVDKVQPASGHPASSLTLCLKWRFGSRLDSAPWRQMLRILGSGPISVLTIPLYSILRLSGYIPSLVYFLRPRD
jgi:2-polyprenyl-3-methyl-5-hydroxy-6-metoxy-1,4-benzoquinol methylase/DNA-directed RNA polymerase subunit RPC12/RpoP